MGTKKGLLVGIILSIVIAYLIRMPVGEWLKDNYIYSGSFVGTGSGENTDAFLFAYILISSFLVFLLTKDFKIGIYVTIPVVLFNIFFGFIDPHLWLSLLLLAVGLGLAWVILKLKAYFTTS